jgi:hypothetical protein
LILASIGLPLIPDQVVSTYELSVDEVVSSGPDRLIVFEGSEERLMQLSVGVLERLGIGSPPWEREEEDSYVAPVRADNQLGTGLRTPIATPVRQKEPVIQETWDDDNWSDSQPRQLRQQRRAEPLYYDDEEEDNWSEATPARERYTQRPEPQQPYPDVDYADEDLDSDAWEDEDQKPLPYQPPRINIPEKTKAPEYEEEGY